jgi:hypothetical protein
MNRKERERSIRELKRIQEKFGDERALKHFDFPTFKKNCGLPPEMNIRRFGKESIKQLLDYGTAE